MIDAPTGEGPDDEGPSGVGPSVVGPRVDGPARRKLSLVQGAGAGSWWCDENTLIIGGPLDELPQDLTIVIEGWLLDHGLDPRRLVPDRSVVRDPVAQRLSWYEWSEAGELRPRTFYRFGRRSTAWPAPFPESVLHR